MQNYQNILIIQLRQLGDILLTTPIITGLREAYPKAKISFLAHPMGHLILDGHPELDELITYPSSGLWRQLVFLKNLRGRSFDLVLDFMGNPRSAFYALTAGGFRLGLATRRKAFYHQSIERLSDGSIVEEKWNFLRMLGVKKAPAPLYLPVSDKDHAPIRKSFPPHPQKLRVVLSPTHRRVERRWPLSDYAWLAKKLQKDWQAEVIWIWGPGEEELVQKAQAMGGGVMAPPTKFREMAALLALSDLFVGNSNGPSHVAVAMGTSSLQLHGPTRCQSWCPMSDEHQGIQSQTGTMEGISRSLVWQQLEKMRPMLEKKRRI